MPAPEVVIRPMADGDAPEVFALCERTLYDSAPGVPAETLQRRALPRLDHPRRTDPGGAWVAERPDGTLGGVGLAIVREAVWGLSLLAVDEDLRERGLGRELVDRCVGHGEARGAEGWLVVSSPHPGAMRRYANAGFALRPALAASGVPRLDRAPDAVARVEDAGDAGLQLADEIGREVRGAGYGDDLRVWLEHDVRLLVLEDRAFACVREANVQLLAARDEAAAALVLWAALVTSPRGSTAIVDFLTAEQQWALRVALDAGLALSPDGPVCTAGRLGPMAPYVPSGAWL